MRTNGKLVDHVQKMIHLPEILNKPRAIILQRYLPDMCPSGQAAKAAHALAWLGKYAGIATMCHDLRDTSSEGVEENAVNKELHDPDSACSVYLCCNIDALEDYVRRNRTKHGIWPHLQVALDHYNVNRTRMMDSRAVQTWWDGRRRKNTRS